MGAITAWGHDDSVTPHRLIRNYIHSKVAIADDAWATIGAANLDGVSLMTGEHLAPVLFESGMGQAFDLDTFPDGCLRKIVLEKDVLPAMRASILNHGITESVVFPDLEGLAKEIKRSFEFEH